MVRKKSTPYEDGLIQRLKEPEYAAEYLNAPLEGRDEGAEEAFLVALRDVAIAHGVAGISKETELGRESLYKALSKTGNPKFSTLASILNAVGLNLTVEVTDKKVS